MSDGLNCVHLIGNLGADPELRMTQAGKAVLNFKIATTEKWKNDQGAWQERTEWHTCVVWGNRATALSSILVKGDRIFVDGSIRTESYDKNGEKRFFTKINVNDVILLGSRGQQQQQAPRPQSQPIPAQQTFAGHPQAPQGQRGYAPPAAPQWGSAPVAQRGFADDPPPYTPPASDDEIPFIADETTRGHWNRP